MISVSTGLQVAMLDAPGLVAALAGGVIRLYGGARPASADADLAGQTPLGEISQNGAPWLPAPDNGDSGLQMRMVFAGRVDQFGTWTLNGSASGTAAWWRFYGPEPDIGVYSTTRCRIDGDCGTDLVLPGGSYALTESSLIPIQRFRLGFFV